MLFYKKKNFRTYLIENLYFKAIFRCFSFEYAVENPRSII